MDNKHIVFLIKITAIFIQDLFNNNNGTIQINNFELIRI
jgi:hypothetical protein